MTPRRNPSGREPESRFLNKLDPRPLSWPGVTFFRGGDERGDALAVLHGPSPGGGNRKGAGISPGPCSSLVPAPRGLWHAEPRRSRVLRPAVRGVARRALALAGVGRNQVVIATPRDTRRIVSRAVQTGLRSIAVYAEIGASVQQRSKAHSSTIPSPGRDTPGREECLRRGRH